MYIISTLITTFNHDAKHMNIVIAIPTMSNISLTYVNNCKLIVLDTDQTQMILIRIPLPLYLIFFFGLSCTKKMRAINTTPALAFYRISCILQR